MTSKYLRDASLSFVPTKIEGRNRGRERIEHLRIRTLNKRLHLERSFLILSHHTRSLIGMGVATLIQDVYARKSLFFQTEKTCANLIRANNDSNRSLFRHARDQAQDFSKPSALALEDVINTNMQTE